MHKGPREVRLPSLSQVARPDILSLDLRGASANYSKMQYQHSGSRRRPGYRRSSSNQRGGSAMPELSFEKEHLDIPFGTMQGGSSLSDLPPLEPMGSSYRRPRKYSSSSSLRADFTSADSLGMVPPSAGRYGVPPSSYAGQTSHLPPLAPIGSLCNLPPLPQASFHTSVFSSFSRPSDMGSTLSRSSLSSIPEPLTGSNFLSSQTEQDWNGPSSFSSNFPPTTASIRSRAGQSIGSGLPVVGGGLKRRASTMNLKLGRDSKTSSIGVGGLPTPISPFSSLSSDLDFGLSTSGLTSSSSSGLGMLPMPSMRRSTPRTSGTGHIVLTSDYRLVRLSQNILAWLGISSASAVGQPMASLVIASDQLVFGDFLASLHAERRKAERSRLHAGLDGGDASARGIACTINLSTSYGGSKPFYLTVYPVTRRMQGYQQAVLTGELVPAFADVLSPIKSVTPL